MIRHGLPPYRDVATQKCLRPVRSAPAVRTEGDRVSITLMEQGGDGRDRNLTPALSRQSHVPAMMPARQRGGLVNFRNQQSRIFDRRACATWV